MYILKGLHDYVLVVQIISPVYSELYACNVKLTFIHSLEERRVCHVQVN